MKIKVCTTVFLLFFSVVLSATNYYVDANKGNDKNDGRSESNAFKSLLKISKMRFLPGDVIMLAGGQTHYGTIELINVSGSSKSPIIITSYGKKRAIIDAKGYPNGILITNSSNIKVEQVDITADGGKFVRSEDIKSKMRCGIMITGTTPGRYSGISINHVGVNKVYFEDAGFARDPKDVHSPNGTQQYGWGIRTIAERAGVILADVTIENCSISEVSHTGIRFSGKPTNIIQNVKVQGNNVKNVGGPGIQFSSVEKGYVANNVINYSGSTSDSRNWGRGSCLWTWGSADFLIEKNSFLNAHGPADSAGSHIDFNCKNIVIQYCLSANNGGGFCEILGNNYNCSYRYNVSVNDGYRVSGKGLAFQEGKTIWYSGYTGKKQKRNGPFNSYVYNNTIFVKEEIIAKMAIENTSSGVYMVNNIFCIESDAKTVMGDQYNPEKRGEAQVENIVFTNNLFLHPKSWPSDNIKDANPIYGNPNFKNAGGLEIIDYLPSNLDLVKKGIEIEKLPNDNVGLSIGLDVKVDILDNKIEGRPCMGAIYVK